MRATATGPYAAHDLATTARFAGLSSLVFGAALMGLAPVAADGDVPWMLAGVLYGLASALVGIVMLRGWAMPWNMMLFGGYVAVAMLAVLQAAYGEERGDLLTELYLAVALSTAAIHPPRRAAGVLIAMTVALVAREIGLGASSVEVADLSVHVGVWLMVAFIASTLTTQLRRQRASARAEEALAQELASTDGLTGLGNRRRLIADLDAALAGGEPHVLGLFDLDGFKAYNDSFGHPAGDALLHELGSNLRAAMSGRGSAYRMGGDEFCVLAPVGDPAAADAVIADAAQALTERGEAFAISASFGFVELPREAATSADALRDADRRMYANKAGGRTSAGRQSADVLARVLQERNPDLGDHVEGVAELCREVGVALGLAADDLGPLLQAAALHDVGKTAIPDAILHKPGALSDAEWAFMRRHTLMGERIMAAAPSLTQAARLVRWSHERMDGHGYPDGLAGEDIPMGARIIFVCGAYNAMLTERPHARAMSPDAALAELRRCAGTQFDPAVVAALDGVLAARPAV